MSKTAAVATNPGAKSPVSATEATTSTFATFQINNAKLYVQVVTLSINDNIKFLEKIPTFRNINRLFVLSFNNDNVTMILQDILLISITYH